MKYLVFVSVLLTIFQGTSFIAAAQKSPNNTRTKNNKGQDGRSVKFIEGIEIKREIISLTGNESPPIKKNIIPGETNNSGIEKSSAIQFKYAQLMNRNVEAVNNVPLFNFIESWWQTKYSYGGNTKKGIDCSGFACQLFQDVYAKEIPRTAKDEYNASEKIRRENLGEGDLVFFNTRGGVSHVGVYLGEGFFVHASTKNGVTINHLDDDYYSARFLGGGRVLRMEGNGLVGTR